MQIDLRCPAMVEAQHSTEPLSAFDDANCRFGTIAGLNQPILDALVIPLPMIMSGVLASRFPQRPFTEEDHPIETLILDRPDESLGESVQVGRAIGQSNDIDTGLLEEIAERQRKLGVAIEDQNALASCLVKRFDALYTWIGHELTGEEKRIL